MIPQLESPPRVRVEWLVAGARMALAAGTLLAVTLDPQAAVRAPAYLLGGYLAYSLALLAMVWTPMRFAPGWDIVVHIVDVAVFALWVLLPDAPGNPLVVYYVFVVVCAMLRWHTTGTVWTAATALAAYAAINFLAGRVVGTDIGTLGALCEPRPCTWC